MRSFYRRHRVVAFILGVVLSAAAGAFAAFIIYQGVTGDVGGKATTQVNTVGAIQVAADYADSTELSPGASADAAFFATNPTGSNQKILTIDSSSITLVGGANPSVCDTPGEAAKIHFDPSGLVNRVYTAGTSNQVQVLPGALSADADWSPSCAGAQIKVTITGTSGVTG
jgi:hypothetical protein